MAAASDARRLAPARRPRGPRPALHPRWTAVLALVMGFGCGRTPHAPALHSGEAVYHNRREGLRFTPPPGWVEEARGEGYPDAVQERLLVEYKRAGPDQEAWLRLAMLDWPVSAPLAEAVHGRAPGPGWRQTAASEGLQVGGFPAMRITYRGRWLTEEVVRETVAVRRGPRVYLFTATYLPSNRDVPGLLRQTLASVVWASD